jgi:hypothetical protein
MGSVRVVNMIPSSLSGETNQDSEPNLAVNPEQPTDMVATAFTPAPLGGNYAPIYISTDAGNTWELRNVVPGNGSFGTGDITVGFATRGGMLYAAILSGAKPLRMQILRTASFASTEPMTTLVQRDNEDQPWVVAGSVLVGGAVRDRVFVGNNDFNQTNGRTATVDVAQSAATAPPPAGFRTRRLEHRTTAGQDGPAVRIAQHPDGTVYAAFQRWVKATGSAPDVWMDIVVSRDDKWGASRKPFGALLDAGDGIRGQIVAANCFIRWNATMGQERLGGDLTIAVDPADSGSVWVAWCDRVGGPAGTDWTLHVRRSTDRGQTWSGDLRTITNAKNPSLAVNIDGKLGLAYQQFSQGQWTTHLEVTADAWQTSPETHILHRAPANIPVRRFFPYLGDYIRLLAVGREFFGVFSGNNTPDAANFPSGVTYQRKANWQTRTLLATDGVTPVPVSIDPFFFQWRPGAVSDAGEFQAAAALAAADAGAMPTQPGPTQPAAIYFKSPTTGPARPRRRPAQDR